MDWILKAREREGSWLLRLPRLHFGHFRLELLEVSKRSQPSMQMCESGAQGREGKAGGRSLEGPWAH